MILSDGAILDRLRSGKLVVDPHTPEQIQPASVDLRLSNHFLKVDENRLDVMRLDQDISYQNLHQDEIVIPPHSFLLATTLESIRLPDDLTAFVEGRSSIGRIGLFIQNAGWVDPGFSGTLTLELFTPHNPPPERPPHLPIGVRKTRPPSFQSLQWKIPTPEPGHRKQDRTRCRSITHRAFHGPTSTKT